MKIESIKEKLEKVINRASKITAKHVTLATLQGLLLKAVGKTLQIRATNLDLGVELSLPVKVEKEGEVVVGAQVLNAFLQNIRRDTQVTLESKDNLLKVTSASHTGTLKTLPVEEFPLIPQVPEEYKVSLPAKDVAAGLRAVWYSTSPSSIKPELSSVYVYPDDNGLCFVATDLFRLAEKKISVRGAGDFPPVLIPFKNVGEIIRFLEEESGAAQIIVAKNQIALRTEGVYLTSRTVEGVFPDYKQIIPKEANTTALLLKDDLGGSLRMVSALSDKIGQVKFSIHPNKKVLEIIAANQEVGESVEKVPAAVSGKELSISFNSRYLADCLPSLPGDSVTMKFHGLDKALVMQAAGENSFTYLVMPMNR